ncbi:MAG TPA: DegT/DnrJ/EryC1/StrS family aminotransferase [Polyangiaceae bacterium]|nr:DegT/DnrJ/EryC1/StrS family aminotransferase [Polyangiaceae bacterium]
MILCSNPHAQYLAHREAIDRAVLGVLASGRYILGEEVSRFEAEFATYLGTAHSVAVANGTDAIHVALRSSGIGRGDEVIAPSHTAVATAAGIELSGASPVFADIDPKTFTLDPHAVERAVTDRTRAIVAVHLYGQAADLDALGSIAERHGLVLIEDCAQAHGATWHGRRLGSIGRLGCFSFYPTKNLGALGDGGLVATNDPTLAARARELREYGWNERRESTIAGLNSRLDEVQAAILRVKLEHLDRDNALREGIARAYDSGLVGGPWTLPERRAGSTHVFHQYVVRSSERDALLRSLRDRGVAAGVHYPVPVHLMPGYAGRIRGAGALPETERAAREVLSLPMYPELEADAVKSVVGAMLAFQKREAS